LSDKSIADKSIAERLQLKGERRLALIGATDDVDRAIGAMERRTKVANADVVLLAAPDLARLKRELPGMLAIVPRQAIVWIAYPKLSSPLASDLSRDVIRDLAPTYGLDTVAQIAIDGDWSALRLKRI
jgi:hypothetical protein